MIRVVHEGEPFVVSAVERTHLERIFGGRVAADGRSISITGVSGHVHMPDGSFLHVRSRKAGPASFLAWAAYADPALRGLRNVKPAAQMADERDLASVLARVFCMQTLRAVESTGLLRAYRQQAVQTAVIRGRIDFSRVVRAGGDLSRTPCIVFARLPHTPLNCLLAAAIDKVRRDPIMREAAGRSLSMLAALFTEVPPRADRDLLEGRRPLSRLEIPFEAPRSLATLLLRGRGLGTGGDRAGLAFWVDVALLFERAVVQAFADSDLDAAPNHAATYNRLQNTGHPVAGLASSRSLFLDVYLRDVYGETVVVDAKYKREVSAANLHQMVTYCWLTGARTAVLVFPRGQLKIRRRYTFPNGQGGGRPITVHTLELDLSCLDLAACRAAGIKLVEELVRLARYAIAA